MIQGGGVLEGQSGVSEELVVGLCGLLNKVMVFIGHEGGEVVCHRDVVEETNGEGAGKTG